MFWKAFKIAAAILLAVVALNVVVVCGYLIIGGIVYAVAGNDGTELTPEERQRIRDEQQKQRWRDLHHGLNLAEEVRQEFQPGRVRPMKFDFRRFGITPIDI